MYYISIYVTFKEMRASSGAVNLKFPPETFDFFQSIVQSEEGHWNPPVFESEKMSGLEILLEVALVISYTKYINSSFVFIQQSSPEEHRQEDLGPCLPDSP